MCRAGHEEGVAEATVAQLATEGAVSDARYAAGRVRARAEQGVGPLKILAEFRDKGVDAELLAEVLALRDPVWVARACAVRAKRFGESLPEDRKERDRQARFLQTRGFSFDQIMTAVRTLSP